MQPIMQRKIKKKTRMLAEAGWTVIRVREELPTIGGHDVVVPLFSSETTRAKAVLKKLQSLGFKATEYEDYLKTETLGQRCGRQLYQTSTDRRIPCDPVPRSSRPSGIQRRTAY